MTKKFALILFAASALINIVLTCLIVHSNSKTAQNPTTIASIEQRLADLEKEVFITPDQLKLSHRKVSEVITNSRLLEGTDVAITLKPTTKVSRQLFMQGLFYPVFQQFHGADKFSLENGLPNFREMQWSIKLQTRTRR